MPKIEDITKNASPVGIAIGLGAAVFATIVVPALPTLVRSARPTARLALKSGLVILERGRELVAEVTEEFEDMIAEVKSELQQERKTQTANHRDSDVVLKAQDEKI